MNWNVEILARLIVATILGAAIGLERERINRAAGLRTHVMVSIGSALFTVLSLYAFNEVGRVNDPARIAAQVVSGIGFLGAGTIMKHGATVKGLTTAATLWVAAAIGMASGAGYYLGATITTIVVLLSLIFLRLPARMLSGRSNFIIELTIPKSMGQLSKIHDALEGLGLALRDLHVHDDENHYFLRMEVQIIEDHKVNNSVIVAVLKDKGAESVDILVNV